MFTGHKQPPNENIVYIKNNDKKIYSRVPLIPILKHYPTYLIWTYDIYKVLLTKYLPTNFLLQLEGLCIEYSSFQTIRGLITIFSTLGFEDF